MKKIILILLIATLPLALLRAAEKEDMLRLLGQYERARQSSEDEQRQLSLLQQSAVAAKNYLTSEDGKTGQWRFVAESTIELSEKSAAAFRTYLQDQSGDRSAARILYHQIVDPAEKGLLAILRVTIETDRTTYELASRFGLVGL
jgi:hypothetical protein